MSVLALCPSRGRPAQAAETLASFEATRRHPASRLVFVLDSDDPTRNEYPEGHVYVVPPRGTMGAALNQAGRDQELLGDAAIIGMVGDDNRFRSVGWDVAFLEALRDRPGIVYGDDGFQHEKLPTSWWVSRAIVDRLGIVEPGLRHYYMDNVWRDLGQAAGCFVYLPEVVIEHMHPLAGKAKDDAIYRRGARNAVHDRGYYRTWSQTTKHAQVRVLREIVGHHERRRVLADWHHPALWESLAILFEDRFGWELYSMLGLDWQAHGWAFTNGTPGWTAADYLEHPTAVAVDGHFEIPAREYPERPRKAVTWAQAQGRQWDFVLASVAVHQAPFLDLARRFGARLIHQVGNARHAVNPRIPAVVLASAKTTDRRAIPYHQEFSRSLFASRPPEPHKGKPRVRSFMLRLETTSGPWEWLAGETDWADHGGTDPRNGHYLAPMARVADEMAAADFIWHDKLIGDGYGHVLHNAAALGRPLIGHASHYRGQLGEPFWRDLETCVDLDRHPPDRAVRLVRAISADPDWLSSMGAAIAETFGRIDFDAEASAIQGALA